MIRASDYLVQPTQTNENQRPQALSSGGYRGNFLTSQTGYKSQPGKTDARQQFRVGERQIRENRPVNLDLANIRQQAQQVAGGIESKGQEQLTKLGEREDIKQFLPKVDKAVWAGDPQAKSDILGRLQGPTPDFTPEYVDTAQLQSAKDFLNKAGEGAYLEALQSMRSGGMLGANRLDAAILAATGYGGQQFRQGAQDLAKIDEMARAQNALMQQAQSERRSAYEDITKQILGDIEGRKQAFDTNINYLINQYKNRDVRQEIANYLQAARERLGREQKDLLPVDIERAQIDVNPFIDRDITAGEVLAGSQVNAYNVLQELLGRGDLLQKVAPQARADENAIYLALLEAAKGKKTERLIAEEQARIAAERARQQAYIAQQQRTSALMSEPNPFKRIENTQKIPLPGGAQPTYQPIPYQAPKPKNTKTVDNLNKIPLVQAGKVIVENAGKQIAKANPVKSIKKALRF